MKTNLEWYMLLPDPYRMQAINNAERDDVLGKKYRLCQRLCSPSRGKPLLKAMPNGSGYLKNPKQESSITRSRLPEIITRFQVY